MRILNKKLFMILGSKFGCILNYFKNKQSILNLLVFSFFFCIFLFIYMPLPILSSGDDHYFHFKFASGLLDNGFFDSFKNFKTLAFTKIVHGEHLMYYNFLFYLFIIPFTFLEPLYLGIKIYAIFNVALIGFLLYFFLRKLNIKYSFLWAASFFAVIGVGTFWRLFLSRPFVFSPIIILLLLLAIHKRKYFWIFILSFIPLFWHTATFFVPILVSVVYFFSAYFYNRRYLWKELLFSVLGVVFAIITVSFIDSGFFVSIKDNLFSVLSSVLDFSKNVKIPEGAEVYPKNLFDLFNSNLLLCLLYLFSLFLYAINFIKDIKQAVNFEDSLKIKKVFLLTFFLLSIVFMISIPNISNRFSDFFIFYSWIFSIFVISDLFDKIEFKDKNILKFSSISLFICIIYFLASSSLNLQDRLASYGNRPETFRSVGTYINDNLAKGDIVFNVDWSWFPQLYYYAPNKNYVIGLEPKLTYLYDSRMYYLWSNISNGYVCDIEKCPGKEQERNLSFKNEKSLNEWSKTEGDKIADVIVNSFNSYYIVSSSSYPALNSILDRNNRFEKVINSDNIFFLYKIN